VEHLDACNLLLRQDVVHLTRQLVHLEVLHTTSLLLVCLCLPAWTSPIFLPLGCFIDLMQFSCLLPLVPIQCTSYVLLFCLANVHLQLCVGGDTCLAQRCGMACDAYDDGV